MFYILENKHFYPKYIIIKIYDCGIILEGWEVKSIKNKNEFQIKNSYIIFKENNFFIKNSFINIYNKNIFSKSNRERELLLKKIEIKSIYLELKKNKYKLIILGVFLKKNKIKLRIALVLKKNEKKYNNIKKKIFERE